MTELDFNAKYQVKGMEGIAFRLTGYKTVSVMSYGTDEVEGFPVEYEQWEEEEDKDTVIGIMVGDNKKHEIDVEDLILINDDDYCSSCGQVGCTHDGRDRSE